MASGSQPTPAPGWAAEATAGKNAQHELFVVASSSEEDVSGPPVAAFASRQEVVAGDPRGCGVVV